MPGSSPPWWYPLETKIVRVRLLCAEMKDHKTVWAIFSRKWPEASRLLQKGICNRLQGKNRFRHMFSLSQVCYFRAFYLISYSLPSEAFLSPPPPPFFCLVIIKTNKVKLQAVLNVLLSTCLGAHFTPTASCSYSPHSSQYINFFTFRILRVVSHYYCCYYCSSFIFLAIPCHLNWFESEFYVV